MSTKSIASFGPRRHVAEIRERLSALQFDHFDAVPQSTCLGAEIRGVDLSQPLSPDLSQELQRALVEFKVIFFRDQDISPDQQAAFV